MNNKYTEEEIQETLKKIKRLRPDRPDLLTREFAIKTLDKTNLVLKKYVSNIQKVAKEENKKSK